MENEMTATLANFMPIIIMLLIFYFLLYRPQKKAQKERQEMLDALKVGVRVITIGGIYGTIVSISDDIIKLKIAENVEIEIARGSVNGVAPSKVALDKK